jgi:hypothetical protein
MDGQGLRAQKGRVISTSQSPAVARARRFVVDGSVFGFGLTVFAVTLPNIWIGGALALVPVFIAERLARLTGPVPAWTGLPSPRKAAFIPAVLGALAFVGYGGVVAAVHVHYFGKHVAAYTVSRHRLGEQTAAYGARDKATAIVIKRQLARVVAKRLSPAQEAKEVAALRHETEGFNRETEIENKAEAGLHTPTSSELPRWFSRLDGFFVAATSVLAGLVIALVLAGSIDSVTSVVLRTSLLFSVIGTVAGLVGNLPSVSPVLHAILLGPLTAGLIAAVAALAVYAASVLE